MVFPTETSYGLGCDATNQAAVDRIFTIKGRKSDKPLLVVVPNIEMAKKYVVWNDFLEKISTKHWPGALTIVGAARPLPTLPLKGEEATILPLLLRRGQEEWSRIDGKRILGFVRTINNRSELRKNKTKAEKILWQELRLKRLGGLRFRRQHGIGPYIVDFYHSDTKTIIEVDGDIHFVEDDNIIRDRNRQKWLEENGYRVLRYNNVDIFGNLDGVLKDINWNIEQKLSAAAASETPPYPPLKRGGDADSSPPFKEGTGGVVLSGLATGVVSKDNTVAVRVTAHPLLKSITEKLGRPLVATSANIADAGDVYSAEEIIKQFKNRETQPDIILDYGELPRNPPTTIVSVIGNELKIIRQGAVII